MLTVDFERLDLRPGLKVLDLGCGLGRHSFEALTRGADVVSLDLDLDALVEVGRMAAAMKVEGQAPEGAVAACVSGDATRLPFADSTFDVVIASEVLEHIPDDEVAMCEMYRILRPQGVLVVSVPRFWPELVCWGLSDSYHSRPGGHVRIYRASQLIERLRGPGFEPRGSHHAHALHAPFWWLKCTFGPDNEDALLPRLYHRFLVWDIVTKPPLVRRAEAALDPILGKSVVVYAGKRGHEVSDAT